MIQFRIGRMAVVALVIILAGTRVGAANVPDQLMDAATKSDFAWQRLARLCDTFGPRFSGSTNLEAAIDWILAQMKKDGLENVHGEKVMVPHWVRGEESAEMLAPRAHRLPMLGLGKHRHAARRHHGRGVGGQELCRLDRASRRGHKQGCSV